MAAISAVAHEKVRSENKAYFFAYYLLDVEEGLQDLGLNEWKPNRVVRGRSREWNMQPIGIWGEPTSNLSVTAALVRKRTQRAQTIRSECFATGTCYQCPEIDYPVSERYFRILGLTCIPAPLGIEPNTIKYQLQTLIF